MARFELEDVADRPACAVLAVFLFDRLMTVILQARFLEVLAGRARAL